MAEDKNIIEENLTGLDKLQQTYEENGTLINGVVIGLLLLILAGLFYSKWYKPNQELKAQSALYMGQFYFEQDSFQTALNEGVLDVAENYGGTKAGNVSQYMAGICYYNLGNYANAEYYLNKFCPCPDDVLGGLALSSLADSQMELGSVEKALKNYKKSAEITDNAATAPVLLLKAGLAHETYSKYSDAKKFYQEIKDNYPESDQFTDIEKYLGRVEAKM